MYVIQVEQLEFAELLSDHLETKIFKRSVESILRAENICKKYPQKISRNVKEKDLLLVEEKKLYNILKPIINSNIGDCWTPTKYIEKLLSIEPEVTSFFENVLVMDDDPLKCGNRLWMCQKLSNWSKRFLDLQVIVFP